MTTAVGMKNIAERLGAEYAKGRRTVLESFQSSPGPPAARALSDATDAFVRSIIEEVARTEPEAVKGIAVAAAGGYGRRQMYPQSDVDVTFIAADTTPAVEGVLRRAFVILSDALASAGVRFGYCYTQPDDLQGLPVENLTSLLDSRLIEGNPLLFGRFQASLRQALRQADFVLHHLCARHDNRPLETPYLVEPDLKEAAGGLRDLHTASWIARVSFGLAADTVWCSLRSKGVLTDADLRELEAAAQFLSALRWTLHMVGGRESLSREKQIDCAAALNYPDAQSLMAEYYRYAAALRSILDTICFACQAASLELEPGINVHSRHINITDTELFKRDAAAIMRVFRYVQVYLLQLKPEAAKLLRSSAASVSTDAESSRLLLEIITGPQAARILQMMAECEVLQALAPDFDTLLRLAPADLVHKFTVGEHTIRVIAELEREIREHKELSDVMGRVQTPECLFVAALMHDIGKIDGEGNHAVRGAIAAKAFAEKLGMSRRQCEAVEFLVREHTSMSDFARLRDVSSEQTAHEFAELVQDPEFLDMLLLLTFADYNAVGGIKLSELHRGYLLELHSRTRALLLKGMVKPNMERHRSRLQRKLAQRKLTPEEIERHCSSLPDRYLLNTPLEDMALHITLARTAVKKKAAVDFQDNRNRQHTRLTAVTIDRQGLLSEIAGTLYALDVNVHSAQVFTRADGVCLDILYVDCDGRSLAETKKDQVDLELTAVLEGATTCSRLLERRGKSAHSLPEGTSMAVISFGSEAEAVVEVRASNMPGLLYALTKHFHEEGLSIRSAKVATWGHRIRDVFYLTDAGGHCKPCEEVIYRLVRSLQSRRGAK